MSHFLKLFNRVYKIFSEQGKNAIKKKNYAGEWDFFFKSKLKLQKKKGLI